MSVQRIAARYAKSLVDLAQEQQKLDRVLEDIRHFRESARVRDLALLLKSPIVHADKKLKIFNSLFSDIYDELTFSFLRIILRKGREAFLPEICDAYVQQYNEINQISALTLTTATPISEQQLEVIKDQIRKSGVTYPNLDVETKVDPSLIGGFLIEFEDKMYNASVAYQMEQLRNQLTTQKL